MGKWIKVFVPDEDFDVNEYAQTAILDIRKKTETGLEDVADRKTVSIWKPQYKKLLDHGHIGLIDFMGDDSSIVNAARTSYGTGTKRKNSDEALIRYLINHRHDTPTEMVEFVFHVKAPIFVFRQWHRHRVSWSYNEASARYSIMDNDMYIPDFADMMMQSKDNKQGRSGQVSSDEYKAIINVIDHVYEECYASYQHLLGAEFDKEGNVISPNKPAPDTIAARKRFVEESALKGIMKIRKENLEKENPTEITEEFIEKTIKDHYEANSLSVLDDDFPGIARELARIIMPVATYSQMYCKANLRTLFHFIGLRSDPHAQKEIRVYSDAMLEFIRPIAPWAVQAFLDYQMNGIKLSSAELETLKFVIDHLSTNVGSDLMRELVTGRMTLKNASKREITDALRKFGL